MLHSWMLLPPLKLREEVETILERTYAGVQEPRHDETVLPADTSTKNLEGDGVGKYLNSETEGESDIDDTKQESDKKGSKNREKSLRLTQTLKWLGIPSRFTILRVNTFAKTTSEIQRIVQHKLDEQCKFRGLEPFVIYPHHMLHDVICVSSRQFGSMVQPARQEVMVDLACGMAVLRGADVFVQGIMGAPVGMQAGDTVAVYADLDGLCRRGLTKLYKGSRVFIGNGVTMVSRDELYRTKEPLVGVGVQMRWPICAAPCLAEFLPELVFPQNLPSALTSHILSPQFGDLVLDMCASPGGKTTHIATLMKNVGRVVALDKTEGKIRCVLQAAARWNLTCVEAYAYDARDCLDSEATVAGPPPYPPCSFDRILLDGPCSALGQRPSSQNRMKSAQLCSFPVLQKSLLSVAVELLKPSGVLVYSTCTVTLEENEEMVKWVLAKYDCLTLVSQEPYLGKPGFYVPGLPVDSLTKLQRFDPGHLEITESLTADNDTIGFFIAKFIKR